MAKEETTRGAKRGLGAATQPQDKQVQKKRQALLERRERELLIRTRRRQTAENAEDNVREMVFRCPKCGEVLDHIVV